MQTRSSPPEIAVITARDGTQLAAAVYRPQGAGPFPVLFAASPYRFDNNSLPASPQFLWRETGPIDFYVQQGYAYVHLDLRGCGRSGGQFDFLGSKDQQDLYQAIEWAGAQSWSSGKVGTIGQSYYCMVQWFLGKLAPPSLRCIGAHDGLTDLYRAGVYHGGIPCDFFPGYWWYQHRVINRYPAAGPAQEQAVDLAQAIARHPLLDEFWQERSAQALLEQIRVPLFSSGVWGKMQLHTRGNIDGFLRASGPRKLRMSAAPNAWAAAAEFANPEFHRGVMLPFYDHYLKGLDTAWLARPPVEFQVRGSTLTRTAQEWPPRPVRYRAFYLDPAKSGSVHSLNDGSLSEVAPELASGTEFAYPNPGWVSGVVGFGPGGPSAGFDAARRIMTFTSGPLPEDLEVAGPIRVILFASSSALDSDFLLKLSDQSPQEPAEHKALLNPRFEVVSRGWLRASHRALDRSSTEEVPVHAHDRAEPLERGKVYRFDISLEPQAYRFAAGHRVRLEIANGDSPVTEALWPHFYRPDRMGVDTYRHGGEHASCLVLPVLSA
jgi:uncharacterized protein